MKFQKLFQIYIKKMEDGKIVRNNVKRNILENASLIEMQKYKNGKL